MTRSRQQEAGERLREETRRRLIDAAVAEFEASGYVGATVARIAQRAGVTVQTLYLACGSKRELLRAYATRVLAGGQDPTEHFRRTLAEDPAVDAGHLLDRIVAVFEQVTVRAGRMWAVHLDASVVDAAVAADWHELQQMRLRTMTALISLFPTDSLRLDKDEASRTLWMLASPDAFHLFTTHGGRTREEYISWLRRTLGAALLE